MLEISQNIFDPKQCFLKLAVRSNSLDVSFIVLKRSTYNTVIQIILIC